ncbi:hypothetical protein K350107B32_11610 [Agathobaculum butyriciproducens]
MRSDAERQSVACEANGILPAWQGHKRVDICADAARAHKRVDTCGFHPLVDHPFPLDSLAQIADM